MSMRDVSVSGAAARRIRSFSVWIWVWGAVVLSIGAFTTYLNVGIGDAGFGILGEGDNPWEMADPPILEPTGTTYSGEGSGLISIPLDEHNQQPLIVHLVTGEYVDLFITDVEDLGRPVDDRGWPNSVAYMYDPGDEALILPPDADLELWVRSDAAWEFTLQNEEVTEIADGFASGKGDGFLVYRGDAVSARFVHEGEGIFFVTVQMAGERSDQPIIETGSVDERLSWNPTSDVYFSIESDDDRGAWTVDIDELAASTPTEPDPTGSPTPVESPNSTPDPVALAPATRPATPASRTTARRHPRGPEPR